MDEVMARLQQNLRAAEEGLRRLDEQLREAAQVRQGTVEVAAAGGGGRKGPTKRRKA